MDQVFPHWFIAFAWIIPIIVAWQGVWKAIALWRAGRNNHLAWFICLIIFNTLGILEIIYIFGFSHKKPQGGSCSSNSINDTTVTTPPEGG